MAGKRWEYLNDYKKNESGKYEYTGAVYGFGGSDGERKKAYAVLYIILAVLAGATIGSGFVDGAGMINTFYVILPYIAEAACLFFLCWYQFKLLTKGDKVKEYVYKTTQPRIPYVDAIYAFFAIAGAICSLVFVITNGFNGGMFKCLLYIALKIISAAAALIHRSCFQRLEWIII